MTTNRFVAAMVAAAASLTVAAAPASGFDPLVDFETIHKRTDTMCNIMAPAPAVKAPIPNPWAPITAEDNLAVWNLLHDPSSGLNLTEPSTANLTDNYVFWIDTLHTNKSDVLPFIEGSGAPLPPKYARAIIFQGAIDEPDSQEYMIGPLPVSAETKVEKLDYIYNGGRGGSVPFNARYFDSVRSAASDPLLASLMTEIADITQALIGGVYYGSSDERTNLASTSGTPMTYNGTHTYRTVMFRYPGTASYLIPLDFFVLLDLPGQDPANYKLKGIVTNSRFFPTVKTLRTAWDAGELKEEFQQTRDYDWALVDRKAELGTRDLEDRFAPQNLEIGGKRYKLDTEERYVEYMGWSFYMSFTRSLGVMLYDMKFKGERVIYELSLQEAAAQYAGNQPKAASTVYHDTYYSLGTDVATLVEGFDCPFGSTFLPISYFSGNSSVTHPNAICIFESDSGFPVSRHRAGGVNDYGFANLGTVKGAALTTRTIATIGNYDYMFDYQFHLDGSLEVTVRASGYLQSSFYYPDQSKFGPRVQVATQGSLHDHVITYKADFDILGTNNSLEVSDLVLVNQTQPWFEELGEFEQMELNITTMETEQQFNWAPNNHAMYCIVNPNATNAWGEKRGYRVVPGRSNIHLTPLNSPFSRHQSAFSKSHLALTVQHDNEPYANSIANINLPGAPQQDFLKFFDGESVEDTDIVLWFNLGMHHFTRAEDIPVTLYTEAVSSIVFAPQNFFDRAQDGDLLNRRWMETNEDTGELSFKTYGVPLPQCQVELTEPAFGIEKITET
ncbi:Fc.00g025890.m01.CDS01 [Cosmosporella sp. VM-42]